ncbi:hypothetical protein PFISCL1PPCAC_25883 [Pristionchus fissidentatus]|uniref:Uncharacterized protein n=1 Tax=Pristionchus fissidentatus TaxID=1538716 RepID=A0AAV5WRD9_9BILA|nr:hypothetical protein PFISCL1PPCAC_25883 [Pristionchus fissidentatus]
MRPLALERGARTVHHAAAHAHVRAARRFLPLLVDVLAVRLAPGIEGVHAVQIVDELGVLGARARHERRCGRSARGIRVRADAIRERAVAARAHLEQRAHRPPSPASRNFRSRTQALTTASASVSLSLSL